MATPATAAASASTNLAPFDASPALGPEPAPVTIVEYADFGCPACWEWYKLNILDQLRAKYGDLNAVEPLPKAQYTNPSLVITPHKNAQASGTGTGKISNIAEEV